MSHTHNMCPACNCLVKIGDIHRCLSSQPAQDNQEAAEQAADSWELYKEKYPPVGGATFYYKDNGQYYRDGFVNGDANGYARAKAEDAKEATERDECIAGQSTCIVEQSKENEALKQRVAELENEEAAIYSKAFAISKNEISELKRSKAHFEWCCAGAERERDDLKQQLAKAEADKAALHACLEKLLDAATSFNWDAILFSRENAQVIKDRHIKQMQEAIEWTDTILAAFPSPEVKL